ncbi:MAG: CHAT domain-containing protein [Caldilineaceae bacterium]
MNRLLSDPGSHDYLSLDVVIDHTEDGYVVRIVDAATGDVTAPFHPPLTPTDLSAFHRLLTTGEPLPDSAEALQVTLQHWGERLCKALFPGALASTLQRSQRLAFQERLRLRIRLEIVHTPELVMLPWEYLFDPVRKEFLALSFQSPFVRYTNLMHQIVPFKVEPPLRMLVVIANPGGYAPFDREQAWFTILDSLDYLALEEKLIVERLTKPTLFDLQRRLREKEFHLLHFIGHGSTDPFTGEGSLIFEDEMGRGRPVNGEHFGALVRDHFSLRLVALTAGEPVRTATANPYLKIAPHLLRRGIPAVIATHSQMDAAATAAFVQQFYALVANFAPVDLAMNEARRTLFEAAHATAWGLPALFMRTANGQLFTPRQVERPNLESMPGIVQRGRRLWPRFGRR